MGRSPQDHPRHATPRPARSLPVLARRRGQAQRRDEGRIVTEIATTDYVMSESDARRLTEKIRITAHTYAEAREKLIGYVEEAKQGSAHLALGYASWTAYLSEVLGEEPMRLAADEKREV